MDTRQSDGQPVSLADLIGEEPSASQTSNSPEAPAGAKPAGAEKAKRGRPPSVMAHRGCKVCGDTHPATPDKWPHHQGKPYGDTCMSCIRERIRAQQSLVRRGNEVTERDIANVANAELREMAKRDALVVARVLGTKAADAIALLITYALDPDSVHHEWALKMYVERIAPLKLFAELGAGAAGAAGAAESRPNVAVYIMPATPSAPAGTVEVVAGPVIDVEPERSE